MKELVYNNICFIDRKYINSMKKRKNVFLKAENLSLEIPIITKNDLSLKKTFVRSITGGRVARNKGLTIIRALTNINLTIHSGERIGLIGHNGAGKSSFIRLLSGIYEQTSGVLKCPVKAFPMLQKSFIVSDSLTGIDEAKARYLLRNNNLKNFKFFLDDITNFSGLGDYIALPIKTYSSGMCARLIFALLTYDSHEFLALDEVIGTGDATFHDKAEERLTNFIKKAGTLIIASHSSQLLENFCKRGLVFSKGSIVYDGKLKDALDFYDSRN